MKKHFWKKVSQCRKTERDGPLGYFNIHCVAKLKKNEGTLWRKKNLTKSRTVPKKFKGGTLLSRPVLYVTRESFLVQFPGPTRAI